MPSKHNQISPNEQNGRKLSRKERRQLKEQNVNYIDSQVLKIVVTPYNEGNKVLIMDEGHNKYPPLMQQQNDLSPAKISAYPSQNPSELTPHYSPRKSVSLVDNSKVKKTPTPAKNLPLNSSTPSPRFFGEWQEQKRAQIANEAQQVQKSQEPPSKIEEPSKGCCLIT